MWDENGDGDDYFNESEDDYKDDDENDNENKDQGEAVDESSDSSSDSSSDDGFFFPEEDDPLEHALQTLIDIEIEKETNSKGNKVKGKSSGNKRSRTDDYNA